MLFEDADLNLGNCGIEIEFLLRRDLNATLDFQEMVEELGFTCGVDGTVDPTKGSLEKLYTDCEIATLPAKWSVIYGQVSKITSYLKREDYVSIVRHRSNSRMTIEPGDYSSPWDPPYFIKRLKLARGRVPQNFSAGVHIHFDANSWFGGTEHAAQFVRVVNQWQNNLAQHLPVQRYGLHNKRGNVFATIQDYPEDAPDKSQSPADYFSRVGKAADRFRALNVQPVLSRGDIEFRFLHGTLNVETIAGWFETLAELITYSKNGHGGFEDFMAWSAKKAPATKKFLDRAHQQSQASKEPPPRGIPTRAVRRLMGLPKASPAMRRVTNQHSDDAVGDFLDVQQAAAIAQ